MGSKHYTIKFIHIHTKKSFNFFWNCIKQAVGSKSLWRLFLELEPEILVFWSFHFNSAIEGEMNIRSLYKYHQSHRGKIMLLTHQLIFFLFSMICKNNSYS